MTPKLRRTVKTGRSQRKLRNFLLQPLLQIQLGLYTVAVTACFSAVVLFILHMNLSDFSRIISSLSESGSELQLLFDQYVIQTWAWIMVLIPGFLLVNIAVTVVYTHKLVGPTVAFRRQLVRIRRGDFSGTVQLRKGDAFLEVAHEINLLTRHLQENNGRIIPGDHNGRNHRD